MAIRLREQFQYVRSTWTGLRLHEVLDELRVSGRAEVARDMESIRNRERYEAANEPVGDQQVREYLFERLESNQMWDKVFGYLTKPSDITSAYFSCETFRRILERKRMLMLLPKVMRVLQEQGMHFENPQENRFLLNLRLASKSWKSSMEEEFFQRKYSGEMDPEFVFENWNKNIPSWSRFSSVEDLDRAIAVLSNSGPGPALIRTIELPRDPTKLHSIHGKLIDFLDLHGEAVWGLKFWGEHAQPYRYDENKYIEILHDVVIRTPHLKALQLNLENEHYSSAEEKEMFQRNVERYPFPKIPSLEFFQFGCARIEHEYLIVEILRKNEGTIRFIKHDGMRLGSVGMEEEVLGPIYQYNNEVAMREYRMFVRPF